MNLIKDYEVNSIYDYLGNDAQANKILEDGTSDEDYINQDLDEKYPEDKYFVLVDYIDDRNMGYFRIRIWRK